MIQEQSRHPSEDVPSSMPDIHERSWEKQVNLLGKSESQRLQRHLLFFFFYDDPDNYGFSFSDIMEEIKRGAQMFNSPVTPNWPLLTLTIHSLTRGPYPLLRYHTNGRYYLTFEGRAVVRRLEASNRQAECRPKYL